MKWKCIVHGQPKVYKFNEEGCRGCAVADDLNNIGVTKKELKLVLEEKKNMTFPILKENELIEKENHCIFVDLCKFYRPFNMDCHHRDQAHERCGQAREKLKELRDYFK